LTKGAPNSRIYYVSGNPNGEAEKVEVKLSQSSTARKKVFNYDFAELEVKGRSAGGNIISKYPLRKVDFLKAGGSTLSKLTLWYDDASGRLNKDKRGKYLGKFDGDDKIIAFQRNGSYKITNYDLNNRYEPEKTLLLEKFNPEKAVSAVYVDGESKQYMVKRFMIETSTLDKEFGFISEGIGSRLIVATTSDTPEIEMEVQKAKDKPKKIEVVNLEEIIEVKGWKALGNRLSEYKVSKVSLVQEEETGQEESEEEGTVAEVADEDQSPKKKLEASPPATIEEDGQVSLFGEPKKPDPRQAQSHQQKSQPVQKSQAEQQSLFGEKAASQSPEAKNESETEIDSTDEDNTEKGDDDKLINPGETIEFKI
jgi:topoisomerase-4 subunit A